MINIFKKLILTLSLIVVVTMGLSKWGPQVTLQAEDTPTQTFTSDRIIAGGVKVDNELLSIAQHTTNMYTSIPIGSYNQYQVTFPNFTSGIDNFQIAIIESAYIIVEMSYVGSSLSGGTYSNFNFEYESTNFVSQESISPRKVQMSID
ncbi:MAG: hypothetical protein QXI16_00600, partial [Sulfolobaceae archaeon]